MSNALKEKKERPKQTAKKSANWEHWHIVTVFLLAFDVLAAGGSYFLALWLRFDCQFSAIPEYYLLPWLYFTPVYVLISILVFWALKLYQSIWRFASFVELERIILSSAILGVAHSVLITVMLTMLPDTPLGCGQDAGDLLYLRRHHPVPADGNGPLCLSLRAAGAEQKGPRHPADNRPSGNAHRRRRCRTADPAGPEQCKGNEGLRLLHHR